MRRILPFLLLILFSVVLPAAAMDIPPLQGHVNDYAGLLSAPAKRALEEKLAEFETTESTQIVVLTVPTLGGDPLEDYSIRLAEAWRIGHKGKDNGVILIIARDERKVRIEVGRGLEGLLTDLVSGRIIRGDIRPHFQQGDFDGGIAAGVSAVMKVVKGEYRPDRGAVRHTNKTHQLLTYLLFFLVACVFLGALSRVLGGLAGAVALPLIGFLLFPGLGLAILAGLGFIGFLIGLFLAFLFGGGGGFGGFGGGPFFGGGFGGFGGGSSDGDGGFSGGGGDFGGGGASGDW
jgi:uncharacterized protein